jgi:hypothetical protein
LKSLSRRSTRALALAGLTLLLALQLGASLVGSLYREVELPVLLSVLPPDSSDLLRTDLGSSERPRPDRELHFLTLPESWRRGLDARPRRRFLRVFVDGDSLETKTRLKSSLHRDPVQLGHPFYRYQAGGRLKIVCPQSLPCRTAVVVAAEPMLALDIALRRLWRFPSRGLGVIAIIAVWVGTAFVVWWLPGPVRFAAGYFLSLCEAGIRAGRHITVSSSSWVRNRIPWFVADLILLHNPLTRPRPVWWRAAKAASLVGMGVAALMSMETLAPPAWETLPDDHHRNWSLEIAVNRAFCGTESRLSDSFSVATQLTAHPELENVALREVVTRGAGSMEEYCGSVTRPVLNNENTLMLEMASFLAVRPQLSIRGLGWHLQAARVLALLALVVALLEFGGSLAFTAIVLASGLEVLASLADRYYSVYPLLPMHLALVVALLSLFLFAGLPSRLLTHALGASLSGWIIALAVNTRSSHLPVFTGFLALYCLAALKCFAMPSRRRTTQWLAVAIAGAATGYALFEVHLIRPLRSEMNESAALESEWSSTPRHLVAHPLVLGLAIPENPLSIREGIEWRDHVGLALARRIDPQVAYLQEGYEAALFTYYRRLWARYPREMLQIYFAKFRLAGASMISFVCEHPRSLKGGSLIKAVIWPLGWVRDGIVLLLLYVAVFWVSTLFHLRTRSTLAFTIALFAAAGAMLQVEAGFILPTFVISHHASQLFCLTIVAAVVWQMLPEALRVAARYSRL